MRKILQKFPKSVLKSKRIKPSYSVLTSRIPLFKFSTEEQKETINLEPEIPIEKKNTHTHEFKAETRKLLDIVAKSLYMDKDVFLRELLSNASDALERQRYLESSGTGNFNYIFICLAQAGEELQISVIANENKKQIIIQDTGIGMTGEEMINNLGTIASSGSRKFLENLEKNETLSDKIIVGFYSSFIVGNTVEVISKPADGEANIWVSDGSGSYELSQIENCGFERGTKIIIHLKSESLIFCKIEEIKKVIQRYSNFINFPINVNGNKVNLIAAIWAREKKDIKDEEYQQFFEYISNSKVHFRYKLHFKTDVPLMLNTLLFIPSQHMEKYGMQMENSEVHLYSRKILIKSNCKELLPNWLRFVKGVVDCEDIPLNISRENYQDSALIAKLRNILTKKIIKHLDEQSKINPSLYLSWYQDFQYFLKEGLASDMENINILFPLLRFQNSFQNDYCSIDEYVAKMKPDQNSIYYILAPNKDAAMNSPYMEPFKNNDIPILFLYMHVDEMVFRSVGKYQDKFSLVNIETNFEEISKDVKSVELDKTSGMPENEITPFCLWMKNELQPLVTKIEVSKRLRDSPAIIVGQMSTGMRQIMQMMNKDDMYGNVSDKNLTLEINPNHELIVNLNRIRKEDIKIGKLLARQLFDNCLITSGLLSDYKDYIDRVNKLMMKVMNAESKNEENVNKTESQTESVLKEAEKTEENKKFEAEIVIDEKGNPKIKN